MEATKEIVEVEQKALTIPEQAFKIIIRDNQTYEQAGEMLKTIKSLRKEIASVFDPIIDKAKEAKKKAEDARKEADNQKTKAEEPLVKAEGYLKPAMSDYMLEQERIRREEEHRLRMEQLKREEEERLQAAIEAEAEGDSETADAIMEEPAYVPPVVIPKAIPKIPGIAHKINWKFKIVDINKIPREYMSPDLVKIGSVVRALKDKSNIPGIQVLREHGVSSGSR